MKLYPLLKHINENRVVKKLALKKMGLGKDREDTDDICTLLLYNETLQSLDLSYN